MATKKQIIKGAKESETIEIAVGGQKVKLLNGFIGGVEATKDKEQVGAYLGDPKDELNMFYSLQAILRSAIKAKQALGEEEEDIRAFLAVVFQKAIEKEFTH